MNLKKSSIKLFAANSLKAVSSFLAIVVFSRELGAAPLGNYYPFIAVVSLLAIPANFGVRGALEKRLSEGDDPSTYIGSAIGLKIPLLILICAIIFLLRDYLNIYLGADLAILVILALISYETSQLSIFILRGELRAGETAVIKSLEPIAWLVFGYYFILQGYGLYGPVYGYIIGLLLTTLVGWWKVSVSVKKPSMNHIRSLFDYSKYNVVSQVGGHVYSWMDVALLSAFASTGILITRSDIGAYENAWRVALLVTVASRSISQALFPQLSRWDANKITHKLESAISTSLLPAVLLTVPGFAGALVLSNDILSILFTPEFTVASSVLIIFMGGKTVESIQIVFINSLQAMDRPDLAAYATAVAIPVNLILNVSLVWMFGIIGAALATVVASTISTMITTHYLRKFITIEFPSKEFLWSIASSLFMGSLVYTVRSFYSISSMMDLFFIIVFGVVAYSTCVLLSPSVREFVRILIPSVVFEKINFTRS
jgi:O-antigen/teichoic acid export membrane protein